MSDLIDWTLIALVALSTVAVLISAWRRKGWSLEEAER